LALKYNQATAILQSAQPPAPSVKTLGGTGGSEVSGCEIKIYFTPGDRGADGDYRGRRAGKKRMSALEPYNAYRQRCHLFAPAPNFAFTRSRNR
jgi:hypothetical protein